VRDIALPLKTEMAGASLALSMSPVDEK